MLSKIFFAYSGSLMQMCRTIWHVLICERYTYAYVEDANQIRVTSCNSARWLGCSTRTSPATFTHCSPYQITRLQATHCNVKTKITRCHVTRTSWNYEAGSTRSEITEGNVKAAVLGSERYRRRLSSFAKMIRGACEIGNEGKKKKLDIYMAEEVTVAGLGNCRRYAIVETAASVTSWKQYSVCLRAERHYSLLWRAAREQYTWKKFYALITESGCESVRS